MKLTSFDVGIRNLAVCVMETSTNSGEGEGGAVEPDLNVPKILHWDVINLLQDSDAKVTKRCGAFTKSNKECGKLAKYKKGEDYFCKTHTKIEGDQGSFVEIKTKKRKVKTLGTQDLCKLLYIRLNNIIEHQYDFLSSDNIIIELQPGKNPRMKSLSNMLYSYFILKGVIEGNVKIVKFVSAKYKLTLYKGPEIECKLKGKYARDKYYGKKHCEYFLQNSENTGLLEKFNKNPKRDDLADCFLQGYWYIQSKS